MDRFSLTTNQRPKIKKLYNRSMRVTTFLEKKEVILKLQSIAEHLTKICELQEKLSTYLF